MKLEPDSQLGPYRLVEKVGEGGMGVVWRAFDPRLRREVALKVLPERAAEIPGRLQRFEREARVVAALSHPNIVAIHSVEDADGVHFLTMELVEGRTLDRVIPPAGLTPERFFELAVPLADALRAAHERGVMHRDLKPSNVMIDREGRPKILDFGLAKLAEHDDADTVEVTRAPTESVVTREGLVVGTVPYMSPEQAQGLPLDHRSDLFSFGVILHEMATGTRPFRGATSAEVVSSILRDEPPPVGSLNGAYTDEVSRVVGRCLAKAAGARYSSAAELRDALATARDAPAPARRAAREGRWRWAIGVAVLVLAAVGVALWRGRPAAPARPLTIGVLPFANFTGDPGQDPRAAGIASALMTQLGELTLVRMVDLPLDRAAEPTKLRSSGVDAIVEGALQMSPRGVRVDVKLTSTESGVVLHTDALEGPLEELYRIQRDLGERLATVLAVPISAEELRRLARNPTESFEAYDTFLRARQLLAGPWTAAATESAIELLRQALRIDDGFALAHLHLSDALWRSYVAIGRKERLDEAEREARRALEIDPAMAEALIALALVHRSRGEYEESIGELRRAFALHRKPARAQIELAKTFQEAGDLVEAERLLRAAVALEEGDWVSWNELAAFYFDQSRYEEARSAWSRAAALAPSWVHSVEGNLAGLAIQQGRFDEAIEILEAIPGPIESEARANNLATAYYFSERADKWEKAEEYGRLAVRLNPRNPETQRNLADVYLKRNRKQLAQEHFRQALDLVEERLRIDPESHTLRLRKAHYSARVGDCATAVAVADILAPRLPATATDKHDLAYAYALCGKPAAALEALSAAVDLGYPAGIIRQEAEFESLASEPAFARLTDPGAASR